MHNHYLPFLLFILVFQHLNLLAQPKTTFKPFVIQKTIALDPIYSAKQTSNKQWGLVNNRQKTTIAFSYDTLYNLPIIQFNPITYKQKYIPSEFVLAHRGNKVLLFSKKGRFIFEVDALMPRLMKNNILLVKKEGYWGLYDTNGTAILPLNCDHIEWYDDILSLSRGPEKYLFDPAKGEIIDELAHEQVQ
jgi:hypothetical protein